MSSSVEYWQEKYLNFPCPVFYFTHMPINTAAHLYGNLHTHILPCTNVYINKYYLFIYVYVHIYYIMCVRVYACIYHVLEPPYTTTCFNTLRPRQNGRHFADDTFKRIFMNENVRISTNISLKFAPKGLINNIPALVQIMAWRRPGDKPLSEPMMVNLLTHICVTRPQGVNSIQDTYDNDKYSWDIYQIMKSRKTFP